MYSDLWINNYFFLISLFPHDQRIIYIYIFKQVFLKENGKQFIIFIIFIYIIFFKFYFFKTAIFLMLGYKW